MTSINDSCSARHRFFFSGGNTFFFVFPARFQERSGLYHLLHPENNLISRIILGRRSVTISSRLPDYSAVRGRFFRQMAVRLFFVRPASVRDRSGDHAGWRPAGFFRDPEGRIRSGLLRPASGFPGAGYNSKASFWGHTRRRALEHCPGSSHRVGLEAPYFSAGRKAS